MSLLIIKNIRIEGANTISGFTYGFPAITQLLGYVHALSRKLETAQGITLDGCAVMCHQQQVHAYRDSHWDDYNFALTRNPLTKEGKTAPIVEEGKMNLTVSLVIECNGINSGNSAQLTALQNEVMIFAQSQRCAGGRIIAIEKCQFVPKPNDDTECRKLLRPLLPGFILCDRSDYLKIHSSDYPQHNQVQNWLDFYALRHRYMPTTDSEQQGMWQSVSKPQAGYLVPIMIGYKQISKVFSAGEVANVRDSNTPFAFTEAVYSIGEWIGSPSRIQSIEQILWRYQYDAPFYLCRSSQAIECDEPSDLDFTY